MAAAALPTYRTETLSTLPNHVTVAEAAEMLGKTTARIRQMIVGQNFKKVWVLGSTYLLSRAEVTAMAEAARG